MKQRWEKISKWLKEKHVDFAFINSTHNIFYLSHFHCEPHERLLGLFVFPEADPFLVCPKMEVERTKESGWNQPIIGYDDVQNPWEMIAAELAKRSIKDTAIVAIEKEQLSYLRVEQLQSILPKIQLVSADKPMNQLRLIKDEKEIQLLKEAARLADYAVKVGISSLKTGITEMEVVAQIELEMKKQGVRQMSFQTMVLFGEKSALPHGNPGTRSLQSGDFALFDLGVILDGYCSDITRTVVYESLSEQQQLIYDTVLQAQLKALEAAKPGLRIGDLDLAARKVISNAGFGEYFPHRLGHGLGIDVHEFPSINSTNDQLLQTGMVFTVEPGIYVPQVGGVRIEDDVVITVDGCETLTRFPKTLQIV